MEHMCNLSDGVKQRGAKAPLCTCYKSFTFGTSFLESICCSVKTDSDATE